DDGGTEDGVDSLTVGGRRGAGVAATAEVAQEPRARLHGRIPQLLAILRAETDDVLLAEFLARAAFRPIRDGDEHAIAPDDGAGLIVIAIDLFGREERRLPQDVLLGFGVPGEGEVFLVGEAHTRGAAPTGPV